MTLHLGAVLRAVLLPAGAAVLVGCANVPPLTPELARFETKELLAASFDRWAADIKTRRKAAGDTAGDDLEFVLVDADLEALSDRAEREALMRIPTS